MQEGSHSSYAHTDYGEDLRQLINGFGSEFSLEDIASAYHQANCNKSLAGEFLCEMHGTTASTATADNSETENATYPKWPGWPSRARTSEQSSDNAIQMDPNGKQIAGVLKPKRCSSSMGTVSGVIGKEYAKSRTLTNKSFEPKKPLKLDSKDFPVSEIWSEKDSPSVTTDSGVMQAGVEQFLFKMLGDGFQLDMNAIQETLGFCGYDIQKSIDKLLDLSAEKLEKYDDVVGMACKGPSERLSDQESFSLQEQRQRSYSGQSEEARIMAGNLKDSPKREKDRSGVEKEVLEALFKVPDRSEEVPKTKPLMREVRRSNIFGKPVVEPLRNVTIEHKPVVSVAQLVTRKGVEDDGNSYEVLRTAVKENWATMREYYKAAVDAFIKDDHSRANKLIEQGQFYNMKAREADEKSCQKLFETRDDVMSLDLCGFEPKEAIRTLRVHLSSLCGIPSIKYLKLIVANDGDTTKGTRKRLVIKQLEKESIKWTEEQNGKALVIEVDVIEPMNLSFAKRKVDDPKRMGFKSDNSGYYI